MAYSQWIIVTIKNDSRPKANDLTVQNASHQWGKFWKGSMDTEIQAEEVNQTVIAPGSHQDVRSCGREGASSGTQGSFDIYDGKTKVCTVSWSCAWGASANEFTAPVEKAVRDSYVVQIGAWGQESGAIGNVDVAIEAKSPQDNGDIETNEIGWE